MYSNNSMNTIQTNKTEEQEDTKEVGATGSINSMSILDLTAIINRYILDIDKIKGTLKEKNAMYKDAFENDAEYHEQNLKVKDLNKLKNAAKQRILKTPALEALSAQIADSKLELKDLQDMLSGYLEQYQKVSGTNVIETEEGDIREIVPVYKLVKRKA